MPEDTGPAGRALAENATLLNFELDDLADAVAARVANKLRGPNTAVVQEYLCPEGAAILLGVTEKSLENWRVRGKDGPPYTRIGGRQVRYHIDDIRAYMREGLVTSVEAEK